MSVNVKIEQANAADLKAIVQLLEQLLDSMHINLAMEAEYLSGNCKRLFLHADNIFLIARSESSVVGFANIHLRHTALHAQPVALIDELVVAADWHGKGVGGQLVQACFDVARNLQCCEIEVGTEGENEGARRFYLDQGFDFEGVLFEKHL